MEINKTKKKNDKRYNNIYYMFNNSLCINILSSY